MINFVVKISSSKRSLAVAATSTTADVRGGRTDRPLIATGLTLRESTSKETVAGRRAGRYILRAIIGPRLSPRAGGRRAIVFTVDFPGIRVGCSSSID